MTSALRRLDDRVLGSPGWRSAASVVLRVVQLVLVLLAVVLVLAVAFVALPVNEDNRVVEGVLTVADRVAGLLRDVFTPDSRALRAAANYGLAALLYLVLASLVGRLRR